MKNKFTLLISVLLVLNLIATCFLAAKTLQPEPSPGKETAQYTLFIGTNDKDTYEQLIPLDEAKQLVETVCAKYTEGFTVQEATGVWNDEKGVMTHEDTIVCLIDDIDGETLHQICDELLRSLNQDTILICKQAVQIEYYDGE